MPPPWRNHRLPTACDTPTSRAASSGSRPLAISHQNSRSTSRRCDGAPDDFIGDRPVNAAIHRAGLPIDTSTLEVSRRPVESALRTVVRSESQLLGLNPAGENRCFDGGDGLVVAAAQIQVDPAVLGGPDLGHVEMPELVRAGDPEEP